MVEQRVISRETGLEDTEYKWGFELDIESDVAPRGLSEEIVRLISAKKKEPEWMLDWRLKAYRHWLKLGTEEPQWANVEFSPIDFQDIIYYAAPRSLADGPRSLDEVDRRSWRASLSSVSRSRSRKNSPASRSMRCWTACPWRRPTRRC